MVLDSFRLNGKVALVTGSARGLGRAIAIALAEAGAEVALLDLIPTQETAEAIQQRGRRIHSIQRDLAEMDPRGATEVVAECTRSLGRLDILINNAGVIRRGSSSELREEDWRAVLHVNLDAALYLSQAAANQFTVQNSGGKIINLASMLSFQGGYQVAAYTASKSGLAGLTRALANEWAKEGINVNAIAPGYFLTEVTAGIRENPARNEAVLSRIPAGRWGEPSDLAGAVVFLASEASAYLHGAILPVDGGWLSW
jgi:2-deoxy-D-gluconate 3-dehydrogenase